MWLRRYRRSSCPRPSIFATDKQRYCRFVPPSPTRSVLGLLAGLPRSSVSRPRALHPEWPRLPRWWRLRSRRRRWSPSRGPGAWRLRLSRSGCRLRSWLRRCRCSSRRHPSIFATGRQRYCRFVPPSPRRSGFGLPARFPRWSVSRPKAMHPEWPTLLRWWRLRSHRRRWSPSRRPGA